jgi:hypothetical protein
MNDPERDKRIVAIAERMRSFTLPEARAHIGDLAARVTVIVERTLNGTALSDADLNELMTAAAQTLPLSMNPAVQGELLGATDIGSTVWAQCGQLGETAMLLASTHADSGITVYWGDVS